MKVKLKTRGLLINLLISVAVSLIVNFSYLVMMIPSSSSSSSSPTVETLSEKGRQVRQFRHYNPADHPEFLVAEFFFYLALAFILLTILTAKLDPDKMDKRSYWKRFLVCVLVAFGLYFFTPIMHRPTGSLSILMLGRHIISPMAILKCSFTLVVVLLYGKIYELLSQKQDITLENERLRNENLQSRYDVLVNQINPHFLFNSLNSLSMLVREDKNEPALVYIDRLSDTFRYILESGRNNMTTLGEELRFADAYKYLLEVRYEGKFFIDIDVDENDLGKRLPALSLQPLIENAVKHNTITRANPLRISIRSDGEYLTVSNPISPKISPEEGTGIGLINISSRYQLLTGREVVVSDDGSTFSVKLPLI